MTRDIRDYLRLLADPREPLDGLDLRPLSNLTREESAELADMWATIPLDKRRRLAATLGAEAEEDVQLDFTALFRHALDDDDATVRRLAIEGLWEDQSVTLIRPLLGLLDEDPSDAVRASAALALGRFLFLCELEELPPERGAEIAERLITIINDEGQTIELRRRALEAAAFSSDERMRDLIARAYEDPDDLMRVSAVFAMGRSADEAWSGSVRAELRNPDPRFRFEAARAAGELYDRTAAPLLVALLADTDAEIRSAAIWSLGQVGGPVARKALQQLAGSGATPALRREAREALAELALLDEDNPQLMLTGWQDEAELVGGGDEEDDELLDALAALDDEDDEPLFLADDDEDDEDDELYEDEDEYDDEELFGFELDPFDDEPLDDEDDEL